MSKLVIFGANGFIGKNLVAELAKDTSNEIIAFDRFTDYQHSSQHPFEDLPNVLITIGDFFNRADLSKALEGADYVFHLVTATTPATSNNDPFIDLETNVKATIELLDLCAQYKIKKVIFPSSGGTVYGDLDSETIAEDVIPRPRSPYGIGKLTIEHYLRYFKFSANLDYIVYRIANPYGPGQNIHGKQGVIPIFMHGFLTGEEITVYGDGDMMRDYIYIDDLVNMIVSSYDRPNAFSEYNLGSGFGRTVNELVTAIEACSGTAPTIKHVPTPQTFVQRSVLDIGRFVEEFGAEPKTSFEDGIRKTWKYVKEINE